VAKENEVQRGISEHPHGGGKGKYSKKNHKVTPEKSRWAGYVHNKKKRKGERSKGALHAYRRKKTEPKKKGKKMAPSWSKMTKEKG